MQLRERVVGKGRLSNRVQVPNTKTYQYHTGVSPFSTATLTPFKFQAFGPKTSGPSCLGCNSKKTKTNMTKPKNAKRNTTPPFPRPRELQVPTLSLVLLPLYHLFEALQPRPLTHGLQLLHHVRLQSWVSTHLRQRGVPSYTREATKKTQQ